MGRRPHAAQNRSRSAKAEIITRTGAGTCATRQVVAPAAGITITNPAGTAGNITLSLANDLAAIEALASTGFAVRIEVDSWAQRTLVGTANEVCVTNGDGVSGSPTFGICSGFLSAAHTWAGAQTFAAPIVTGAFDMQGTVKLSSFLTSTQITANQNNYTATDGSNTCSTKAKLRISTDASRNITGLSCGQAEGDVRIIHNVGAQAAVLTNQDIGSTAANRFLFGGDMTLPADTSVTIRYDGVAYRWRAVTTSGAGGCGVISVAITGSAGTSTSGTCTITTSGTCDVHLDINSLTADTSPDSAADYVPTYDASFSGNKKVVLEKLGSVVLLNTLTANNTSAQLDDTTSFTSSCSTYEIVLENLVPATTSNDFILRFQIGGSFVTSNYRSSSYYVSSGPALVHATQTTYIQLTNGASVQNIAADGGVSGTLTFVGAPTGSTVKTVYGKTTYYYSPTTFQVQNQISGMNTSTSAVTGVRITTTLGGNILAGAVKIYCRR